MQTPEFLSPAYLLLGIEMVFPWQNSWNSDKTSYMTYDITVTVMAVNSAWASCAVE